MAVTRRRVNALLAQGRPHLRGEATEWRGPALDLTAALWAFATNLCFQRSHASFYVIHFSSGSVCPTGSASVFLIVLAPSFFQCLSIGWVSLPTLSNGLNLLRVQCFMMPIIIICVPAGARAELLGSLPRHVFAPALSTIPRREAPSSILLSSKWDFSRHRYISLKCASG